MSFPTFVTELGKIKMAQSLADGTPIQPNEIAWGDGDYVATGSEAALQSERGRKDIQIAEISPDDPERVIFEVSLDFEEGPFTIREAGLFDADGDLLAICTYTEAIPKAKDSTSVALSLAVFFSNLANLNLVINSAGNYVTQAQAAAYASKATSILSGGGLSGGGDLTGDRTLSVNFASEAEAVAGVAVDKAVTPATVKSAIDALINSAPGQLDTLDELAAALGDDPDFSATIVAQLAAQKMPSGVIQNYAGAAAPAGWLECDGAAVSRATYADLFVAIGETFGNGDGASTFNLPDLRGEFVRGWDNGRGVDAGRALGSAQADEVGPHQHDINHYTNSDNTGSNIAGANGNTNQTWQTELSTGTETRPRNIALMFIIRT